MMYKKHIEVVNPKRVWKTNDSIFLRQNKMCYYSVVKKITASIIIDNNNFYILFILCLFDYLSF